ncbi:hypothetical protein C4E24_09035 [ANME-1 cluster archaeon AG-394-G21]|nr:hypothetical protein [ANME-1 cluster archaeon AG-394-G21]
MVGKSIVVFDIKAIVRLLNMMVVLKMVGIPISADIVIQKFLELLSADITKMESHLLNGYYVQTVEMVLF